MAYFYVIRTIAGSSYWVISPMSAWLSQRKMQVTIRSGHRKLHSEIFIQGAQHEQITRGCRVGTIDLAKQL